MFHIDESSADSAAKFKKQKTETKDAICCVCTSGETLVVARESGAIHVYSLPRVTLETKVVVWRRSLDS